MGNTGSSVSKMRETMYLRIRCACGVMGMLLPWLALLSAGIATHPSPEWWWSLSATYYQSPALVAVLAPACVVLICYSGYEPIDHVLNTLSGIFGLCIILFPCKEDWIADGTRVGFFQLPIEVSHIIHCISAVLFFALVAVNIIFMFTKTDQAVISSRKRTRNTIYRVCGIGILVLGSGFGAVVAGIAPQCLVFFIEVGILMLFGFAWLVKGEVFPFLNDVKPEEAGVDTLAVVDDALAATGSKDESTII